MSKESRAHRNKKHWRSREEIAQRTVVDAIARLDGVQGVDGYLVRAEAAYAKGVAIAKERLAGELLRIIEISRTEEKEP